MRPATISGNTNAGEIVSVQGGAVQPIYGEAAEGATISDNTPSTQDPAPWSGKGTAEEPYEIKSESELTAFAHMVNGGMNYEGVYFQLGADIVLTGEWTPIGTAANKFSGSFDGGMHTINGLTISGNTENAALFGVIGGEVTIKNLALANVNINTAGNKAAGVVAFIGNKEKISCNTVIENVSVSGSVTGAEKVAGIVAQAPYGDTTGTTTITGSTNNAEITATSTAAGDIQRAGGILSTAGGNYATNKITLTSCENTGAVKAPNGWAGGMIACLNQKNTTGISEASVFEMTGCANTGTLTGTATGMVYQEQGAEFPTSGYAGELRGVNYLGYVLSSSYYNNIGEDGAYVSAMKAKVFDTVKSSSIHFKDNAYAPDSVKAEWYPAGTAESAMSGYACYIAVDGSFLAFDSVIGAEMACLNSGVGHTIVLLKNCEEDVPAFLGEKYDTDKNYYQSWRSVSLVVTLNSNGYIYEKGSFVVGNANVFQTVICVAQIGDEKYLTLEAAIDDVTENHNTITLLADYTLAEPLSINKAVTLELGGKELTVGAEKGFQAVAGGNITVKNGMMISDKENFICAANGGKIKFVEEPDETLTVTLTKTGTGTAILAEGEASKIEITGGRINGSVEKDADTAITISGGIFSNEIPEDFTAEGYAAFLNEDDGTYTVKQGYYVRFIAGDENEGTGYWSEPDGDEKIYEQSIPVEANQTAIEMGDPTWPGHIFIGWTLPNGDPFDPAAQITKDLILKANFLLRKSLVIRVGQSVQLSDGDATVSMDPVYTKYLEYSDLKVIGKNPIPDGMQLPVLTLTKDGQTVAVYQVEIVTGDGEIVLPAGLTALGANAFGNTLAAKCITVGAKVTSIAADTFAGSGLRQLMVNSSTLTLPESFAFNTEKGLTILCESDSALADQFARGAFADANITVVYPAE